MKVSVIIVNYNVRDYLRQCLISVKRALNEIGDDGEVIVIDNCSLDGSIKMLEEEFKWVKLIKNSENLGFSRANNQGIKIAQGEYILLLNPDTIIPEETFKRLIEFMDNNLEAGAVGVKLIDGKGKYLPESMRGFPDPKTSFFKITGIYKLFPNSATINRYYLGNLDKTKINEIEVLSGSFMFIRKKIFDEIGLLDERFFMYAEDIDLSYRIREKGYKIFYYPYISVVHYKGRSTKKTSLDYLKLFYSAMLLFINKYYEKKGNQFYVLFLKTAVFLRASLSAFKNLIRKIIEPLVDFVIIYFIFLSITFIWQWFNFQTLNFYPINFYKYILTFWALVVVSVLYYFGIYLKNFKKNDLIKGLILSSVLLLVSYALFSESIRYSRAILIIGILLLFFIFLPLKIYFISPIIFGRKNYNCLLVSNEENFLKNYQILMKIKKYKEIYSINYKTFSNESLEKINELLKINKINEIILCNESLSIKEIILSMTKFSDLNVDFLVLGDILLGTNITYLNDNTYVIKTNSVANPLNKHNKRLLDIFIAIVFLFISPLLVFFVNNKKEYFSNIIDILLNKKTWVGYSPHTENYKLPKLKESVFPITNDKNKALESNLIYANQYSIWLDLRVIMKNFKELIKKQNV